uniref:Uncharacterized protein n=1 Tax=Arundo donax TaxID=35708 RepID=A0A0A9CJ48_ARUDO
MCILNMLQNLVHGCLWSVKMMCEELLFDVAYDEMPHELGVGRSKSLNFRENLLGVLH